jgi:hypothetical protein
MYMDIHTRHVQRDALVETRTITERWIEAYLGDLRLEPFRNRQQFLKGKRHYDGEIEAAFVLTYMRYLSRYPAKLRVFRKFLRPRINRIGKDDPRAVRAELHRVVDAGKWVSVPDREGLLLLPLPLEGIALLAVLMLLHKERLGRIRKCKRCEAWFYARFKHAQFCSKKCQENDYHSPEWRKKNRERNRKHQSEYRKRNPGRRQ